MRVVMFYHSLLSDWNHGNAHFLRGIATELMSRGHELSVYEPADSWSRTHLLQDQGESAISGFHAHYPRLKSTLYNPHELDLDAALQDAAIVIVHEWNPPELVRRIGAHHAAHGGYRLFFHDTHHRSVSDPSAVQRCKLCHYDGVLAFGKVVRDLYLERGWAQRAWTWHEAADVRVFKPLPDAHSRGDLVWIGNWGDDERTAELQEFLIEPVRALGLKAAVYGVRYPANARAALARAGIEYKGWLPNFEVPDVFARYKVTVHVPRAPYVRVLPGIPTIRVFEALACGIPLISAPWQDCERLFRVGQDFLMVASGREMERCLREVTRQPLLAQRLAANGRETILQRHTCAHRVDQLLEIQDSLGRAMQRSGDTGR